VRERRLDPGDVVAVDALAGRVADVDHDRHIDQRSIRAVAQLDHNRRRRLALQQGGVHHFDLATLLLDPQALLELHRPEGLGDLAALLLGRLASGPEQNRRQRRGGKQDAVPSHPNAPPM
jgi:hypothetical protein